MMPTCLWKFTSEAGILYWSQFHSWASIFDVVLEAVSRVPGLKSRNVGRDYHKMLWIGWDELLVRNACDRYMDVARINLEARRKIQRKYHADLAKRRKEKQQEKGRSTRTDDSLS